MSRSGRSARRAWTRCWARRRGWRWGEGSDEAAQDVLAVTRLCWGHDSSHTFGTERGCGASGAGLVRAASRGVGMASFDGDKSLPPDALACGDGVEVMSGADGRSKIKEALRIARAMAQNDEDHISIRTDMAF